MLSRIFKILTFSLWLAVFCISFSSSAFAAETKSETKSDSFDTKLTSTYTVNLSGQTHVEKQFKVTNKMPTLYISSYSLEITSSKIANVHVTNEKGEIPATVTVADNKTKINITFADTIVGTGKVRTFSISYDDPDSAVVSGNTLEVYIPKLTTAELYSANIVVIKTPLKFDVPVRVNPNKFDVKQEGTQYVVTMNDPGTQGISALFGQKQYFQFALNYDLNNPTNSSGIMQIALPPDSTQQRVLYDEITPPPTQVTRDADGNWIATFEIEAQQTVTVVAKGRAMITLQQDAPETSSAPTPELTSAQKYWETSDPKLAELAKKYTTPRQIYDYLTSTFVYNYSRTGSVPERLGAAKALNAPDQALCQEFTDAFIALARANGIPARRLTGFAYTSNSRLRPLGLMQDVLHAWPEYYDKDKQKWIAIDPTWGQTTGGINYFDQLDFNHFVFAINGHSSNTPYAAGSYRKPEDTSKQIDVSFAQQFTFPDQQLEFEAKKLPWFLTWGKNGYELTVINKTGTAFYNVPILLESDQVDIPISNPQITLPVLLPFQRATVRFAANSPWWQFRQFILTVRSQQLSSSHALQTGIQLQDIFAAPQIAISVGGSLVFIAIIAGSVLVSRRPRQRSVRR